ncbi:MAG: hypothetical protein [Arizlama microvirus]|nr:MAG: hypothetical protein [Arizlama microvirus]
MSTVKVLREMQLVKAQVEPGPLRDSLLAPLVAQLEALSKEAARQGNLLAEMQAEKAGKK